MKLIFSTLASLALAVNASAFGLDFSGATPGTTLGTTVDPPLVINVPGYGNVEFSAGTMTTPSGGLSSLVIGKKYREADIPTKTLQLDSGEFVLVRFLGVPVTNVSFGVIGVSGDETATNHDLATGSFYGLDISGGDGGGLKTLTFNAIPEPGSAALVGLGALGLLFRRRR